MSLRIIKAGILDTVQDLGRFGYQHLGINPGGAMDLFSAALANALLGKDLTAPVIEMHFPAAQILFEKDCIVCITGADFFPTLNDIPVSLNQPIAVKEDSVLTWKGVSKGARSYLSVFNNLQLEKWLGSYSTNLKAGAGGFNGRKLERYDALAFDPIRLPPVKDAFIGLPWKYNDPVPATNEIEFIPGNEWTWLPTKSQTDFLNKTFVIGKDSDRMGYRLQGTVLEQAIKDQLVSSAVSFGTIQLPPDGQLIILMADHQTTGGYPRVGHVISTSLPALAQMQPNEALRFVMTNITQAEKKAAERQHYLMTLQNTCNLKMKSWINAN